MKRIIATIAAISALSACNKLETQVTEMPVDDSQIVFMAAGLKAEVATKADAVTTLSSFGVIAEETTTPKQAWSLTAVTKSGTDYKTGKYWPSTDQKYAFYASNAAMTYATTGTTVSPANAGTDVVVAYLPYAASTYKVKNQLVFNHIYARIGAIAVNKPSGYDSISNVSLALSAPVGGTYNIKTSTWTSKGTAAAQTLVVGSNDVYVVPGTYDLSVAYTLTKGDYVESFTKHANVDIQEGKINSITATAPNGNDAEIVFTIKITDWGDHPIEVVLS